ncbi:discoidin domain-containing protein [Paraglaciecola aestuariivivens]
MTINNLHLEHGFSVFKGKKSGSPLTLDRSLKARFIKFSLQAKMCLHLDKIQVFDQEGNNIALNSLTLVSSMYNDNEKYNGQAVVNGDPKGGCGHHTKTEINPWLIIDLKKPCDIAKIVVFNRDDAFYHRALSLVITASNDLNHWDTVFDNYAYKLTDTYLGLPYQEQCLLNCAALEIEPLRKLIKQLNDQGDNEQAVALLAKGNEALAPYNLSIGPHGLTRTFAIRSDSEKDKAYLALSSLLNILTHEFGTPAFASSGTLLGLVREGQFLGHDDDLDICYISQQTEEHQILKERQQLSDFLNANGYKVSNSNVAHLWCKTPQGMTIDIFTGWLEGERCIMNPLARNGVPKDSVLPLKTQDCNGFAIQIPQVPVDLLEHNYGKNWQKPDPLWVFDWGHARKAYDFLYF